jgi:hypothetical protein
MNSKDDMSVGIVSAGIYLPKPILTAVDIAEQSGLPELGFERSWAVTKNTWLVRTITPTRWQFGRLTLY